MRRTLVTAPAVEPLTLSEARVHLREPDAAENALILALIKAAREKVEAETQRALLTQTWQLKLDRFPRFGAPIELPLPPLQAVTSITYLDSAGAPQTWASSEYVQDAPAGPWSAEGRVYPALEKAYPATAYRKDAVTIEFVAGWATAADVPEGLKSAMKLLIGNWFEYREATISGTIIQPVPMAADALMAPFRRLTAMLR